MREEERCYKEEDGGRGNEDKAGRRMGRRRGTELNHAGKEAQERKGEVSKEKGKTVCCERGRRYRQINRSVKEREGRWKGGGVNKRLEKCQGHGKLLNEEPK